MVSTVSAKSRILNYLAKKSPKGVNNTLTTRQAQSRFGISNVAARVAELRQEGYSIYTNSKKTAQGNRLALYRWGRPSASFINECEVAGVTAKGPQA